MDWRIQNLWDRRPLLLLKKRILRLSKWLTSVWKRLPRWVLVFPLLIAAAFLLLVLAAYRDAELMAPAPTALFEDRSGRFLAESEQQQLGFWAPPTPTPERIRACVIAAEDRRFYQHGGIDLRSMARAGWNNLRGLPRQGASTIAMQVARLQRPAPRTLLTKARESLTAWFLVQKYGHEALIRHYLTLIPQGNRMFGTAYAARRYFRKPLADLSWAESALLAALPKAPGDMNLYKIRGRQKARQRAAHILRLLLAAGKIDAESFASSLSQLESLHIEPKETRPEIAFHAILRLRRLMQDRPPDRPIRTSLDLQLQGWLQELADQKIDSLRARGAGNLAMMVADLSSGQVLAYLGSADYRDIDQAGAIDYANTPRSSGSTLKPFFYALGLDRKLFTPASILPDLPMTFSYPSGQYTVHNYDHQYLGPLPYRQALANSRNIPAVSVLAKLGLHRTHAWLCEQGIVSDGRPADWYGLGLAIGGAYVRLTDLIAGYGILAREGEPFELNWFLPHPSSRPTSPSSAATSPDEQILRTRPLTRDSARQLSLMLSDPQARLPSFSRGGELEYPFPVAVKTGTSQGFRDAWCLAYSRRYLVGVWIGHPDHQRMNQVNGQVAAGLVQQIVQHLHPDEMRGLDAGNFPAPEHARQLALCSLTGALASRACDQVVHEYFPIGSEPRLVTQAHVRMEVDSRTGAPIKADTPLEFRVWRRFTELPALYASWAAGRGLQPPPQRQSHTPSAFLSIQSPAPNSRILLDPDSAAGSQSLTLRATVEPRVPEILWYVNGKPWRKAAYPYEQRWPLEPGRHRFQARFPRAEVRSQVVTIEVRE